MTDNIPNYSNDEVVFISDTHFGHANIIKYCDRPFKFPDTSKMDELMWEEMLKADEDGKVIVHVGDFIFYHQDTWVPKFKNASKHILVLGNHDKPVPTKDVYPRVFGNIIGHKSTWREHYHKISVNYVPIILSHEPQKNLHGCQFNIYGHHHNNMVRNPAQFLPDYSWIMGSTKHINVGVELTGYKPVTFEEAKQLQRPKL